MGKNNSAGKPAKNIRGVLFIILAVLCVAVISVIAVEVTRTPTVSNIQNRSAMSDSVLVQWSCDGTVDHYRVEYRVNDGEWTELISYDSIMPIRGLDNGTLELNIYPVRGETEYPAATATIEMPKYSAVTSVDVTVNRKNNDGTVQSITDPVQIDACSDTLDITWEYDGEDCGFYVYLDPVTKDKDEILPFVNKYIEVGEEHKVTVSKLSPNTTYKLSIVPDTTWPGWYQRMIVTKGFEQYNGEYGYRTYDAIITGTTTINTAETSSATALRLNVILEKWRALEISSVPADGNYQVALILDGAAVSGRELCTFGVYTYNSDGQLECYYKQLVNINNLQSTAARVVYRPFAAPETPGEYTVYITVDGRVVAEKQLTVTEK